MIFTRLAVSAVAIMIAVTPPLAADPNNADQKNDRFTVDHVVNMKTAQDVRISPDGQWVAYVVRRNDTKKDKRFTRIWMSSVDGKTHVPLTAVHANASRPRWNPDGSSIAFLGKRGDKKDAKPQVWLLDRRGGEAQQYTDVKQGVSAFDWAPDGKRMVLTIKDPKPEDAKPGGADEAANTEGNKAKEEKADKDRPKPFVIDRLQFKRDYDGYLDRRRNHLYLFDGSGKPEQITFGDYDEETPVWSPDGTRIAFVSKREGDPDANDNSDIWVVSTQKGVKDRPLIQVTKNKGADKAPTWSPDGTAIAYVTSREPEKLWYDTENLAITSAVGKGVERVLTADYDRFVFNPRFAPNGKGVYFTTDDGGTSPVMKADVGTGAVSVVGAQQVAVSAYDVHADGRIATIQSVHHSPPNVHVIDKDHSRRITSLNADLLEGVMLAKVERLKVAGWNGDMVESFVYYPPGYDDTQAYPTIFQLHGGPVSQHDVAFDTWAQVWAANGYIAVLPNPHGSSGYGEPFTYALNRQWGVPDFKDIDAIADHLVEKGISDGKKLGVGGWSYGGILTNYVITKTGRFAGAVTGASEVNHRANYGHDHYQHFWEVELGLPWENIDAWEAINPFNDLGNVTTPTLVMGGQVDWNVPILNSEQIYQVLKRRGIETQLIVYPGEHHGFRRPSFIRDRLERYLAWFETYVKGIKLTTEK